MQLIVTRINAQSKRTCLIIPGWYRPSIWCPLDEIVRFFRKFLQNRMCVVLQPRGLTSPPSPRESWSRPRAWFYLSLFDAFNRTSGFDAIYVSYEINYRSELWI